MKRKTGDTLNLSQIQNIFKINFAEPFLYKRYLVIL